MPSPTRLERFRRARILAAGRSVGTVFGVAILLLSAGWIERAAAQAPAPSGASAAPKADSAQTKMRAEDCVSRAADSKEIYDYAAIPNLVVPTQFVPAGIPVEMILRTPFKPDSGYYGRVAYSSNIFQHLDRVEPFDVSQISAVAMPESHPFVRNKQATVNDTLITVQLEPQWAGLWQQTQIFVYACPARPDDTPASPTSVSLLTTRVTSVVWSAAVAWAGILLIYLAAAGAAAIGDGRGLSWKRFLDPVFMTAGPDGRGSLAKLQILFFSIIVFSLLAYIVLRTGLLSELSTSILMLLGITAAGSTVAKATDATRSSLSSENILWLRSKGWWQRASRSAPNAAKWSDIISTDGEFDVYRYQSCIFSLVVGGALIAAGIGQLASFEIPSTLLGVLGLSQVVYVSGKFVSPTSIAELNKATDQLRGLETTFRAAARRNPDPAATVTTDSQAPPADLAAAIRRAPTEYADYMRAADIVRADFESLTDSTVEKDRVQPSIS